MLNSCKFSSSLTSHVRFFGLDLIEPKDTVTKFYGQGDWPNPAFVGEPPVSIFGSTKTQWDGTRTRFELNVPAASITSGNGIQPDIGVVTFVSTRSPCTTITFSEQCVGYVL